MKKYIWFIIISLIVLFIIGWSYYKVIEKRNLELQETEALKNINDELVAELAINNGATLIEFPSGCNFTKEIQDLLFNNGKPIVLENVFFKDVYRDDDTVIAFFSLSSYELFPFREVYLMLDIEDEHRLFELLESALDHESSNYHYFQTQYTVALEVVDASNPKFSLFSHAENMNFEIEVNKNIFVKGILKDFAKVVTELGR
ncbi:MAG: hypothetical protein GX996_03015 [Firmicutes bacterium]|nr:hypothetical protein [Bacillota bacterium]